MTDATFPLALTLVFILGLFLGWYLGYLKSGSISSLREHNARLNAQLTASEKTQQYLTQQVQALQERSREDADVLQALAPVKVQLATMERSVRAMESQRSEQYGAVSEALKASAQVQENLRTVTQGLSSALRSSSARGVWGETQLRRVVEAAGMTRHVSFQEQVSATITPSHEQERVIRPDMLIHLPGEKIIILDAKTPLNAYLKAQEAGDDENLAQQALAQHVKEVRAHIDTLARKKYWTGFSSSPELVLCFIPLESALSAALQADSSLLDDAYAKNIALVSPVSLLSCLKAISFSWRQETLTDNAKELLSLSQELYERLGTASAHLQGMGRSLNKAVESYNSLVGSLETRVFVTARKIADLDSSSISSSLRNDPLDSFAKPLGAPEFVGHDSSWEASSAEDEDDSPAVMIERPTPRNMTPNASSRVFPQRTNPSDEPFDYDSWNS
ncbi:DNA recombination protein RmuC [Rothia sp. P7181]|uniref:DNA recombination protein RmuC n=1 Tax=Rothia sp. P7181 TaxID=3402663 RepID=UPI003AED4502